MMRPALSLVIALLAGCGSGGVQQASPSGAGGSAVLPGISVTGLSVTPQSPAIKVGETVQLGATLHFSDGSSSNVTSQSSWGSSLPIRSSVDSTGLASALLPGLVSITARLGNLAGSSQLNVIGNERISLDSAGQQSDAASSLPSVSGNGRWVAFSSEATNLVADDTNGVQDIFVRDRETGSTSRVNLDSSGNQADALSYSPFISANGRYVVFSSDASNLVPNDTNARRDIFVRDLGMGVTSRVSLGPAGAQANSTSFDPSISGDGRFVAFDSFATNLVSGSSSGRQVYVHDRQSGVTSKVSLSSAGVEGDALSQLSVISADGRFVAFYRFSQNLVAEDTNGAGDIFLHDLQTGSTLLVSRSSAGQIAAAGVGQATPSLSQDGRFVAFSSSSNNLVAGDNNGQGDVFVHDRVTGTTTRVSLDSAGQEANGSSSNPSISGDGQRVAFDSSASNLVPNDPNLTQRDIFLHLRATGETRRLIGPANNANLSLDGLWVAFSTAASTIVTGDTNGFSDIFITNQ